MVKDKETLYDSLNEALRNSISYGFGVFERLYTAAENFNLITQDLIDDVLVCAMYNDNAQFIDFLKKKGAKYTAYVITHAAERKDYELIDEIIKSFSKDLIQTYVDDLSDVDLKMMLYLKKTGFNVDYPLYGMLTFENVQEILPLISEVDYESVAYRGVYNGDCKLLEVALTKLTDDQVVKVLKLSDSESINIIRTFAKRINIRELKCEKVLRKFGGYSDGFIKSLTM